MTINNLDKYIKSLWDWGFLDRCFKRGIKVTDIDGLVEAGRGHFLLIEAKSPGVAIRRGQADAFTALVRTGFFTVLILWGERNKPEEYCFWNSGPIRAPIKKCDEAEIQFLVSEWFESVEISSKEIA